MPKAAKKNSTPPTNTSATHSRRSILGAIAGIAAAAGSIATLALPTVMASAPDPIWARSMRIWRPLGTRGTAYERLLAAGPEDADFRPMQAAVMAEYAAAGALIETAPTTRAGLRALESLLREDRSSSARWCIRMPTECGYYLSSDRPEGVDWLIAKLAAEIGMAAVHAG